MLLFATTSYRQVGHHTLTVDGNDLKAILLLTTLLTYFR